VADGLEAAGCLEDHVCMSETLFNGSWEIALLGDTAVTSSIICQKQLFMDIHSRV
jgi:hypothetical protein